MNSFCHAMLCIRGTSHGPVSVCLSVCVSLSVTSRSSTKTAKRRIIKTTPHDSTGTLVFWLQRSPQNSTGVTPLRGHRMQVQWVKIGDFRQITGYISTRSLAVAEWPRDASCQLKSCQLPRNSAETTCTTSPEQIKVMKLKRYSKAMRNKHVQSTTTRQSRCHCLVRVINKQTTVELCISPIYRRIAVAKFSKSTM